MIFGKTKLELKVGVFVFTGVVVLTVFILLIGNFKTWSSGYRVNFIFNFVNGVKVGAPVRVSGVDAGEIKEIKFTSMGYEKPKIIVNCWLSKEVAIPADSQVWVNTLGLLGEKYIEVMPGSDYAKCLLEGEELVGKDPLPMHEVGELAKKIASDLDEAIVKIKNKEGTVGKLLYDDKVYTELEALITDIRKNPWKLFFKTKEKK